MSVVDLWYLKNHNKIINLIIFILSFFRADRNINNFLGSCALLRDKLVLTKISNIRK